MVLLNSRLEGSGPEGKRACPPLALQLSPLPQSPLAGFVFLMVTQKKKSLDPPSAFVSIKDHSTIVSMPLAALISLLNTTVKSCMQLLTDTAFAGQVDCILVSFLQVKNPAFISEMDGKIWGPYARALITVNPLGKLSSSTE